MNYYVSHNDEIPQTKWGGEGFASKVEQIEQRLDELVSLYVDKFMTFEEIQGETGITWWTIKDLFKKHDIKKRSISERARLKRSKDFDQIYWLVFKENMSLKEIYRVYKYSPPYVRATLADIEFRIKIARSNNSD